MKRVSDSKEENIGRENVYYWMNKYINLLEKYNELLLQQTGKKVVSSNSKKANNIDDDE